MHSMECNDPQRINSKTYTLPQIKLVLITLLLLFFALFVVWRQRRRAVAITCMAVFWVIGAGWISTPLLALAQRGFEVTPSAQTVHFGARTTFILLGGGTEHDPQKRLIPKYDSVPKFAATADLYHACQRAGDVCRVIVSGGNPQHHEQAEADNYLPYLLARDVKSSDLVSENTSLNTYENARNVASLLGPQHDETLILVTTAYQMPRALLCFHAFGLDPQPFVSSVKYPRAPTLIPRGRGYIDAETALHELVGIARFYVWRFLHLY
jgi:uncharacterized SAM-binding protein YcdF (DUF218 family)